MIDIEKLREAFQSAHGGQPRLFAAPGRVNLIGEHTDYNDGFVLPVAIDRRTIVAGMPRADRIVRVSSLNVGQTLEFDLDAPGEGRRESWLDYIEGVARVLQSKGHPLCGAELMLESDVPGGAGLSSSAALEISAGLALLSLANDRIGMEELALAGQQAEHRYVGTMCGIMDQFVSALGRAGHALLIDCRSLEYRPIPMAFEGIALVICDTGVKHSLASTAYNTRRAECERGVEILREYLPSITALRDVSPRELERYEGMLPEPVRRRCRHVVTENERTLRAAESLAAGRLEEMGRLMAESHRSLRDDYEVSVPELDLMVEIASSVEGTIGARMTGGGFGGSTVNLVRRDAIEEFRRTITERYTTATGIEPEIYLSAIGPGAEEII